SRRATPHRPCPRTALARALVFDPVLVLMDEPFGALDRQLREQMQIEVKQIHARLGNTMISVTHDQGEAIRMSDRIAVFHEGRLQQVGPPEEIYERPSNSFVARFLGEANTLNGRVSSVSGGECVVVLDGGQRVVATATAAAAPGARTSLILRPDRLCVGSAEAVNSFVGRIRDVVYCGDHVRYHAEVLGRDDWVIKLAHRDSAERLRGGASRRVPRPG